ncbi:putative Ig domain-containing protein, partial [Puniceicoccaceae bacterium K14]|nr:putative Ig domain-containing protein [Puniceicoccaceae bacterium K14]
GVHTTSSDFSSAFAAYVNAQYANGATQGDYIFIRLSPSVNEGDRVYWVVDSSRGSVAPSLALEMGVFNSAPELVGSGLLDDTVTVGESWQYDVSSVFSDPDGDALVYTFSGLPSWVAVNGSTLSGVPDSGDVAQIGIIVTATDPFGEFVEDSFTLTVEAIPDIVGVPHPLELSLEDGGARSNGLSGSNYEQYRIGGGNVG